MARRMIWAALAGCVLAGLSTPKAQAANWADSLFAERSHNFGPVPRGAKVKHEFVLNNRLAEPVTILNLRPSCGCTSGKASTSNVGPGESAVVEAQMDTRNFLGHKATILFVTLVTASGREAEVRLNVVSNILADIVLNPGSIDFGAVLKGQGASQTLTIDRINGRDWRFERMVSGSRALTAQLVETKRDPNGSVSYKLEVGVKSDAPAGPLREEIRLLSNDRETPSIPIMVTGWVRGDLTASPSLLTMGEVNSTEGKQGRFVIRASKPFAITQVDGAGDGFSIAPPDAAKKTLHMLTVAYKPEEGTTRGDLRRIFRVSTDIPGEPPLDLTATLHVAP
ncbi:MAG: DUF1573 domain-containing protein [Paludisphaera borealis]|uniref:DUF1573 domain-containing protein n=1 Tax=Paludisphaera borealis TaxID=1387353 RepID=UPI002844B977|nr:DUF1573 domain-containing protein [Paludisphaera borealis]MDR3622379.1 DUF1573 domain-containing protein [Paludisphaera borealis]